jgi:hypothetical protein
MSEPPPKRTYSQEEVTEILKRAMKQQRLQNQDLSHEELVEIAGEVGIDRGAVESATAELVATRAGELAREQGARELAEERARLFNGFVSHLFVYLVIGGALYFIDHRLTGGTWFYWVLLGWGTLLLLQLRRVIFPQGSLARRKARELKRASRLERRALREAKHKKLRQAFGLDPTRSPEERGQDVQAAVQAGAREFETAVQAGVAALLNVTARKIHEHASRAAEGERAEAFDKRRR